MAGQRIAAHLSSGEFEPLLHLLKLPETNQLLKTAEVDELVSAIASVFHNLLEPANSLPEASIFDEIIGECCLLLRNSCAIGAAIQNHIASSQNIFPAINLVLLDSVRFSAKTRKMCWQFVANLCVQNPITQRELWQNCLSAILPRLNCICETGNGREFAMILYNLFLGEMLSSADVKRVVELLLHCLVDQVAVHESNDFQQLFMEHLITQYRAVAAVYDRLMPPEKRVHFIYYIGDHMKVVRHDPISTPLLQFICKEFKKKSDCVLKATQSAVETIHPREVVALLDVIARTSADERYSHILSTDASLFINVGCLLRSIHDIGKRETDANIFAPVQKLTQLAPNSSADSSIERDISYQLKSTLIRTLANLAYKNTANQNLAREMEFIMAVLDSTALDARNPLLKEWSILAIRNLCEGNMENQQIIRQLTKVGDSQSDTIKEFNLDLGSLRINPNE